MSYDGFYGGLSQRGTVNEILDEAKQVRDEVLEAQAVFEEGIADFNAGVVSVQADRAASEAAAASAVTAASTAVDSAALASGSEIKAKAWATNPENSPVEPGLFSALHWAIKSANSAAESASSVTALRSDLALPTGASLIGVTEATKPIAAGTVQEALQYNPLRSNITLLVPTDFPDLQAALDYCSSKRGAKGFRITVLIESGYVIQKGFRIDDVNLSHVVLKSQDATVPVSPIFEHIITYDLPAGVARGNYFSFVAVRSTMPMWDLVIDHAAATTDGGYCLYWGSGFVNNYKGVINADHTIGGDTDAGAGFKVGGSSHLIAPYALATGCGVGMALTQATLADVQFADTRNARLTGIDVSRGSVVYSLNADVSNAGREGYYIRRSRVIAEASLIQNCSVGIRTQATSTVSAVNANFDGTTVCVNRGSGSTVEVTGATKGGVNVADVVGAFIPAIPNNLDISGITYTLQAPPGNTPQLTKYNRALGNNGGIVSAAPRVYTQLTTISGNPRQVLGGSIAGPNVGFRLTIDGVVAINFVASTAGKDSAGNDTTHISIPPFACTNSYTLEVFNLDFTNTATVGWSLFRVI